MTHEFIAPWWSIQVVDGFLSEQKNECANFWREDGVGALQISAHSHDSGSVPADDLENFMKGEVPDGAALKPLRCGQFVGVRVDYVEDGKFWRKDGSTKDLCFFLLRTIRMLTMELNEQGHAANAPGASLS